MNKYYIASLATILRMTLLALLLPSNHVFADPFVDLLKGVAASIAKGSQNNQQVANGNSSDTSGSVSAGSHSQGNPQTTNSGNLITSASQYCEAIENNKLIREFSTQLARSVTFELALNNSIHNIRARSLDDNKGNLTQWVYKQLGQKQGKCYSFNGGCFDEEAVKKVMSWVGYCKAKHVDDELFFFFHDWGEGSTIRVEEEKNRVRAYDPPLSAIIRAGNRLWGTLIAVSLPNGINALEAAGKQNAEEFRAYLDANIKEHEESNRVAAEKARQEKIREKADSEFANSPNGKLAKAYQSMEAINQCVEVREGYAMVYINDAQHTKAKKLMRRIEAALKNKLQGTTADELWKKTASNVDIKKGFIHAKLWSGANEIQVCQAFIQQLEGVGENVLGKNAPEKSW